MTRQEMFDRVWDWFVTQGKPLSVNESGLCMYRGQGDCRCAVGVLIPDDLYLVEMESCGPVTTLARSFHPAVVDRLYPEEKRERMNAFVKLLLDEKMFVRALQRAHDHCQTEGVSLREWLMDIATSFNLKIPETADGLL